MNEAGDNVIVYLCLWSISLGISYIKNLVLIVVFNKSKAFKIRFVCNVGDAHVFYIKWKNENGILH